VIHIIVISLRGLLTISVAFLIVMQSVFMLKVMTPLLGAKSFFQQGVFPVDTFPGNSYLWLYLLKQWRLWQGETFLSAP
jgi:hypothetical protein